MDDIESDGASFALVHHGGDGEDALLGDTLVQLAEQIAEALDCSECCVYEYIAERDVLRAQALWSRVPTEHDIDWVGETHRLADAPGFKRVIEEREVLVLLPGRRRSTRPRPASRPWSTGASGPPSGRPSSTATRCSGCSSSRRRSATASSPRTDERLVRPDGGARRHRAAQRAPLARRRGAQPAALGAHRRLARHDLDARPGRAPRGRLPPGGARPRRRLELHLRVRRRGRRHGVAGRVPARPLARVRGAARDRLPHRGPAAGPRRGAHAPARSRCASTTRASTTSCGGSCWSGASSPRSWSRWWSAARWSARSR